MKRDYKRLIAAVLLTPLMTTLPLFMVVPLFSSALMLVFMVIGVFFTIVYGVPVSAFLRYKKFDGYQHYAIAGIVPATIWVLYLGATKDIEYLSSSSLIWMAGGILAALSFRWVRGGVNENSS